jgi:hypothetical protein
MAFQLPLENQPRILMLNTLCVLGGGTPAVGSPMEPLDKTITLILSSSLRAMNACEPEDGFD